MSKQMLHENSREMDVIWNAVCSNNIAVVQDYVRHGKDLNRRYKAFGKKHSLIMGALRNRNYDMVRYLMNNGGTITQEEGTDILLEFMRIVN